VVIVAIRIRTMIHPKNLDYIPVVHMQ